MRFKKYFMVLIYFGKERKRTTIIFLKLDFSLLLCLQLKVVPHLDSMWFLPYQSFVQLPCPWLLVLSHTLPLPGQFRSSDRRCFWCSLHRELSSTDCIFRYPNNLSLLTDWGGWKVEGKTERWFHLASLALHLFSASLSANPLSFLCLCKLLASFLGLISPSEQDMKQNRRQLLFVK